MKQKLIWFALGVITAVIVFVCLPFFVPVRKSPDPEANGRVARVELALYELESLRSGDTNRVIEHLEAELDSRIEDMGDDLNSPHKITRHHVKRALLHAKEYRIKYPRKTINPQVDEAVEKVFSKLK